MALDKCWFQRMNRAVFLDRDGILNVDRGYTFQLTDLVVPEGVAQALARLKSKGLKLVVITNQSGVARGKFTTADVDAFHSALQSEIQRLGGPALDLFKSCPHHPDGHVAPYNVACACRKPAIGLITDACVALDIDPKKSFMIGDKWSDILCAHRAGAKPILVQSAQSLSYDLPDDVRLTKAKDRRGKDITIATSFETGGVEVYSSLSDAVSLVLESLD